MFFNKMPRAPEFPKSCKWLNTNKSLSLKELEGHVIVLDFWTYCCINCMHILPDLEKLEQKYADKPVVVVGVHSAKFEEESESKNIEQAISRYEIKHPVIVDQKMGIWNSYGAIGWPTLVVIDPEGNIVYNQSGEGQLGTLINLIDVLLEHHKEKGTLVKTKIKVEQTGIKNNNILSYPAKMCFSPDKKKFAISDSNHNRIVVCTLHGKIEKIIGSGKKGFLDGKFSESEFNRPQGIFWNENKIYVTDTENHSVRVIDLGKGEVETIAGTGRQASYPLKFGKGKDTSLSSPWDLVECKGKLYIAMAGTHQVWSYDLASDKVEPFAGSGYENIVDGPLFAAQFAQPSGITFLNGSLYIADSEVSGIRKIDLEEERVSTISGEGLFSFGLKDGRTQDALFQHPLGICSDGKDNLYIADTYNNSIRQIDLEKGEVTSIIKKSENNICMIGEERCNILGLWEPSDVKYLDGKLYIVDTNNHLIRISDLKTKELKDLDIVF